MLQVGRLLTSVIAVALTQIGGVARAADDATLIRGARVFDGTRVVDSTDVLVHAGKIEQVGKSIPAPAGAVAVDGKDCTLLPGLIDCHTHVISDTMLEQALMFGVTTELDMFMSPELATQVKRNDRPNRADIRTAGILVTAAGGHGTQFGMPIPTLDSPDKADAFVAARIAEGSDYIKIVYDTGASLGLRFPTLNKETLTAVIAAAKRHGTMAVVHVGDCKSAVEAIEAGADGLVHAPFDKPADDSFVTLVKSKGAFVIPTLSIIESACGKPGGGISEKTSLATDEQLAPFLRPADISMLRTPVPRFPLARKPKFEDPLGTVRKLHAAGVPLLAGTDAPNPGTLHGASLHRELELLVQAGMKPAEALAAATSVPAKRFSLADRGKIEPGARADLQLVKGDPTTDIRATRAIVAVWRAGVRLDRDAYRGEIDRAKLAAGKVKGPGVTLVSDFEGKEIASTFGAGWQVSTDSLMRGKSTAGIKLGKGGAGGSKSCLLITGNIDGGLPFAWAGAMFYPGPFPFAPADLAGKKRLTFWAKGEEKPVRVMLFAQKLGRQPASQDFTPGKEWKRFSFELSSFNKIDGSDLQGLLFTGGPAAGEFEFQIDDVMFE